MLKHVVKWVKGYIKNEQRLYRCSCGVDIVSWSKRQAVEAHKNDLDKSSA